MIINRGKLSNAVSDSPTRFTLNGVYVDGDKAIACDGRMIAIVPIERGPEEKTGVIVPTAVIKAAERFGRRSKLYAVKLNGKAEAEDGSGWSMSLPYIDGNYPKYKDVIPDGTVETITLDARKLLLLAEAIGAENHRKQLVITLHVKSKTDAVKVTCQQNPNALGVIMPCA